MNPAGRRLKRGEREEGDAGGWVGVRGGGAVSARSSSAPERNSGSRTGVHLCRTGLAI